MSSRPNVATVLRDQRGRLRLVGDVAGDGDYLVTGLSKRLGGGLQACLVAVGEHDSRPGARKDLARSPARCRS